MKLAVTSDIHGSLSSFNKVKKYCNDIDMLLIAGDLLYHGARNPLPEGYNTKGLIKELNECSFDLLAVKGNVDAVVDDWVLPYPLPEYSVLQDGKFRIVMYHGHLHDTEADRIEFAKRFGADLLIFGHTHQPVIKEIDGIILLNPGSISLPKQDPQVSTLAIIEEEKINIISLEEGEVLIEYNY